MRVKLQILRDDGRIVVEHIGDATQPMVIRQPPDLEIIEEERRLAEWCYLPYVPEELKLLLAQGPAPTYPL